MRVWYKAVVEKLQASGLFSDIGLTPEQASTLFRPTIRNPNRH